MKVAIVGRGRQGQKHGNVWKKFGVVPQFFSKFGAAGTRVFSDLNISELYSFDCIVIAVSPISEQEGVIQKILSMQYPGLLIIEKPICSDLNLLFSLKERKNTIFFIDEIFLADTVVDIEIIGYFEIYAAYMSDFPNVLEHAFGCFLGQKSFHNILNTPVYYHLASSTYYKIYSTENDSKILIDSEGGEFGWITHKLFRFDIIYKELLLRSRDFQWLMTVRHNYYIFRLLGNSGNK